MSDILCAKCGEPWDLYGVNHVDMKPDEAKKFLAGKGCPCCRFGTACPSCDGTGRDPRRPYQCEQCRDSRYLLAWSPRQNAALAPYRAGEFYTGYVPGVRHLRDPSFDEPLKLGVREFPELIDVTDTRDGPVENWWVPCDACQDNPRLDVEICVVCNGTGELSYSSRRNGPEFDYLG